METKTYTLKPEKKFLKQGYFLEDESGTIVYEAKMVKQSLIGAMEFDFINHVSNKTEKHKVGHTITQETTGAFEVLSTKSYFKFDGVNIWDYLHEKGIRIDSNFQDRKIGMTYDVTFKGEQMATIVTYSPKGKSIITSSHYLNITTSSSDLDLIFLTAFAISNTEQTFYN